MEAKQRQQKIVLGALLAVLASVAAYQFWPSSPDSSATSAPRASRPPARGAAPAAPSARGRGRGPVPAGAGDVGQVAEVGVSRLSLPPPEIAATGRNPFRFQPKAVPPPPRPPNVARRMSPTETPDEQTGEPGAPPPPPPPPPITLKFIGVVSGEQRVGKVAVLSDGKFVYYGREGDIIEGRYRVLKIGEESVQMEYVDGRGRQTIRLTGA